MEYSFGRGRGTFVYPPKTPVGRGRALLMTGPVTSTPMPILDNNPADDNDECSTQPQISCVGLGSPSTDKGNVPVHIIAGIAKEIGMSIGESIAASIDAKLGSGANSNSTADTNRSDGVDTSLVNLVARAKVKEPVFFKGDGLDAYTIHEWETVVMMYLRKRAIPVNEQAEEVMSRLMGKAREVVKVGIRSNPSLVLSDGPGPIFHILKQHFSDTVSSVMPMADFYTTLPFSDEDPFEYWLRLNRAMEVTEDCLKRQNKTVDDPSRELTTMFIRHCPDSELSLIFKCKPLQQWTAADVHEKLVEHGREKRQSSQPRSAAAVTMLQQEVRPANPSPVPSGEKTTHSTPSPALCQPSQGSAESLDRIIGMLERLLEQGPQQDQHYCRPEHQSPGGHRNRVRASLPCEVCGDREHNTRFHCRANHLCYLCYASGHRSADCPKSAMSNPKGAAAFNDPATQHKGNEQANI
ncbi:uncharacterized protein LOC115380357 [Myripristis murdjan]|uniref:uncharacterized protein LOC115380357 n=1 Tax=Myripristis murdjan TaxID=586833 RepID=UPI001175F0F2|nr:uncharacterized protein LOC115380357 [Myripristis murdjan]